MSQFSQKTARGTGEKRIKILIVDDSALARKKLKDIFENDPEIEVVNTAADPYIAVQKIKKNAPDVITLDLEMPRMDGLIFLKKIMDQHPIPVVVISSHTPEGSSKALRAFELGAVEVIGKPRILSGLDLTEFQIQVCDSVHAAYLAKIGRQSHIRQNEKFAADAVLNKNLSGKSFKEIKQKIIVIGASTGGTVALERFLTPLPELTPGIVIVQHMPENFTFSFAQRLNRKCRIEVREAKNGDVVKPGTAYIARGDSHLLIKNSGENYYVEVKKGPLVNRHRPSVDVLFRSAARYVGENAIGIIMTGMGDDGARGLLEMKQAGAKTIAQDEKSCVVFGMPREAIKLNCVDKVVPLEKIPEEMFKMIYK